jgi:hypothetical protein
VERLRQLAGATEFVFHERDVLWADIEETDLLFLDTWHVYGQLKEEMRLHAGKVRRYIVLHDTTTFGEKGEAEGHRGLWPAVEEFLAQGTFRLKQRVANNNGLTVLEALRPAEAGYVNSAHGNGYAAQSIVFGEGIPGDPEAAGPVGPSARLALADRQARRAGGVGGGGPAVDSGAEAQAPNGPGEKAPSVRLAILGVVHNEEDLIGPFLEHYFGQGADTVFLLNDGCTDHTLEVAGRHPDVVITDLEADGQPPEGLRARALESYRAACAGQYDYVAVVEADEFLLPKEGGSLKDALLRHRDEPTLGAECFDVIQGPDEPPYDPSLPLLQQRRWGVPDPAGARTVVLRPGRPTVPAEVQSRDEAAEAATLSPFCLLRFAGADEGIFRRRRQRAKASTAGDSGADAPAEFLRDWQALQGHPGRVPLPVAVDSLAAVTA